MLRFRPEEDDEQLCPGYGVHRRYTCSVKRQWLYKRRCEWDKKMNMSRLKCRQATKICTQKK